MINTGDIGADDDTQHPADLRIGTPERQAALEALETHLVAGRLNSTEYERRVEACELARTQAELLRIFSDLPVPHPQLPSAAVSSAEPDDLESIPPIAVAGCLTLGVGLPVAVVLGFVYGSWWALAVPVAVTVAMAYVEHLRTRPRDSAPDKRPAVLE